MTTTDAARDDAPDVWSHRSSRQRLVRVLPFTIVALVGQLSALFNPTNMGWYWLSVLATRGGRRRVRGPATPLQLVPDRGVLHRLRRRAHDGERRGRRQWPRHSLLPRGGRRRHVWRTPGIGDHRGARRRLPDARDDLSTPQGAATTGRRLLFLGAIAAVMSVSIHALRERLEASNRRTRQLLHQSEAMNEAARELALLRGPELDRRRHHRAGGSTGVVAGWYSSGGLVRPDRRGVARRWWPTTAGADL